MSTFTCVIRIKAHTIKLIVNEIFVFFTDVLICAIAIKSLSVFILGEDSEMFLFILDSSIMSVPFLLALSALVLVLDLGGTPPFSRSR